MRYSDLQGRQYECLVEAKTAHKLQEFSEGRKERKRKFYGQKKGEGIKEHFDEQETQENRCYEAQRESDLEKWRQMVKTVKSVMVGASTAWRKRHI